MQGYQTFKTRENDTPLFHQGVGRKDSKKASSAAPALVPYAEAGDRRCGRCRRPHAVGDTKWTRLPPALARCARPRPASNGGPCKGSQARAWPPQRSAAGGVSLRQQWEAPKGTLDWVEHRETSIQSAAGGSRGREGDKPREPDGAGLTSREVWRRLKTRRRWVFKRSTRPPRGKPDSSAPRSRARCPKIWDSSLLEHLEAFRRL